MTDSQTRFDNERLDARLEHVTRALCDSDQDGDHLRRLATVGTVAGLIAHEFRNLMTPVQSYAQLALRKGDDPELTRKALMSAYEGAQQAVAIAESLMDLIGMSADEVAQSGGAPADGVGERCHVEQAVRAAVESVEMPCAESAVTVELDLEPGLEASIAETDLRQVLSNLIQNAVRASGLLDARGSVVVSARSVGEEWSLAADLEDRGTQGDRNGECSWHIEGTGPSARRAGDRRVIVEVCDSGCGIAAGSISRVFEPFVSGGGGRGMGLATCRALVGKAGGRLGVSSGAGLGTRFVLEFG